MDYPAHPAKRAQLGLIVVGILTLPIIVGVFVLAAVAWRHYSNLYSCDGEFVRSNIGIVSRDSRTVRIRDLREVGLKQSIMGRILNYGDLTFDTAGGDSKEVLWWGVRGAPDLSAHFEELMRA